LFGKQEAIEVLNDLLSLRRLRKKALVAAPFLEALEDIIRKLNDNHYHYHELFGKYYEITEKYRKSMKYYKHSLKMLEEDNVKRKCWDDEINRLKEHIDRLKRKKEILT